MLGIIQAFTGLDIVSSDELRCQVLGTISLLMCLATSFDWKT